MHAVLGRQHQSGHPINFDGTVATTVTPEARSDWNCSNSVAVNLTSDNRYLLESWWFSTGVAGTNSDMQTGQDGATRAPTAISIPPLASQMIAAAEIRQSARCVADDGPSIGRTTLERSSQHDHRCYQPGRWYAIQGYFLSGYIATGFRRHPGAGNKAERCPA